MPTMIGAPKWPETIATVIAPAGIIEPIEMSSSPAIISRPTGSATMPRLAATLSQLAAPVGREEVDAAEDREEDEDEEEAEEGAGLGPAEQAAEGKFTGLQRAGGEVVPDFCRVWAIMGCPCVQGPVTVCASAAIQVRLAG